MTSVDRGRYGCMTDGGLVVAMKARELGKGSVVVGDRVALASDASGAEGTLARIVRVEPRPARCGGPPTTPTRWSGSSWPTPTSW